MAPDTITKYAKRKSIKLPPLASPRDSAIELIERVDGG